MNNILTEEEENLLKEFIKSLDNRNVNYDITITRTKNSRIRDLWIEREENNERV